MSPITLSVQIALIRTYLDSNLRSPCMRLFSSHIEVSYRYILTPGRAGAMPGLDARGPGSRTEKDSFFRPAPDRRFCAPVPDGCCARRDGPAPGKRPGRHNRGQRIPQAPRWKRSEEHTSELQSLRHLVCRL